MKFREQLRLVGAIMLCASVGFAHDDDDDDDDDHHHGNKKTFILATGRRDPRMYGISLEDALKPANQNTPNAIRSRSKVALDRLDGRPLGDSANIVISEDGKTAYVVNHHGSIDNAEFLQHGGRANLAVMNIKKMLNPSLDNTAAALKFHIDSGWFGGVGLVLLPNLFVMGAAENHLTEDGGNRFMFIDRKTGSLRGMAELRLNTSPLCPAAPDWPVPFVSPHGPPTPAPLLSPNAGWGCYPDTNGIVLGHASNGKSYLFGANGGTDDVSVLDLESALAGNKTPEVARIPTQIGPWGITVTPNGKTVIAANRESQKVAFEGNTISFIDVDKAAANDPGAEVARVLVGTSDPTVQTRPFIPSVTPDGKYVIVPCFRSNNVSIVDIAKALAHDPSYEVARIPLTRVADPDGVVRPSRPKGSAISANGRYAAISAGPRTTFEPSGYVYVIDLQTKTVVGTVTGVGNDPYGLATTEQ